MITLELISKWIKISLRSGNQVPLRLEENMLLMRPRCFVPLDGGISDHMMYKNVYATYRLICNSVVGSSRTSSFYNDTSHIIHMLMTRDHDFYLVQQLFDIICE